MVNGRHTYDCYCGETGVPINEDCPNCGRGFSDYDNRYGKMYSDDAGGVGG